MNAAFVHRSSSTAILQCLFLSALNKAQPYIWYLYKGRSVRLTLWPTHSDLSSGEVYFVLFVYTEDFLLPLYIYTICILWLIIWLILCVASTYSSLGWVFIIVLTISEVPCVRLVLTKRHEDSLLVKYAIFIDWLKTSMKRFKALRFF